MEIRVVVKTVWSPTFLDVKRTGEMLENRFEIMPRLRMAAQTPIGVKFRVKRTVAALFAIVRPFAEFWLIRPLLNEQDFGIMVRPVVSNDTVLVHRIRTGYRPLPSISLQLLARHGLLFFLMLPQQNHKHVYPHTFLFHHEQYQITCL